MANSGNQKRKLLMMKQIFEQETSEAHPMTVYDFIGRYKDEGMHSERKSVTADIHELIAAGMDIERTGGRTPGYYLASRTFELPEVKMLADAVAASRFITEKKSRALLRKLGTLTDQDHAAELDRQVLVTDRVKADRETGYYVIDLIFDCINSNRQLRFHYTDWKLTDTGKRKVMRRDGDWYVVSPLELLWDSERYYLIAWSEREEEIRYYRVDKILDAGGLSEARSPEGIRTWEHEDPGTYTTRTFGMFAGEEKMVLLEASASLTGVLIDRFGQEVSMRSVGDDTIRVRVPVEVSGQFYGWVTGIGPRLRIVGPKEVVSGYQSYLADIMKNYQ